MPFVIDGFTDYDKVPGAVAVNKWAAGKISIGSIPLQCVLFGNKTSAGAAATATKTGPISTPEEADAAFGAKSELARMLHAALDIPGVTLYGNAVAEAGSAVAATATLTIAGSWTTAGEITLQLDELVFRVTFGTSDSTVTLAAAAVVLKANQQQDGRIFYTAANLVGVTTFTVASAGVRGNQHTLYIVDQTRKPTGMTLAIAGGTALGNGGVPFTGGTGTDDVTLALAAVSAEQNDYEGFAQNDSTNIGLVETATAAKAAFDVELLQQYVTSTNGTLSTAITLGQTGMNDPLGCCAWVQYGVEHPSRVTARLAAYYSVTDGASPNKRYDNLVLPGAAPQFRKQDVPNRTTMNAALNASVMPFKTEDAKLKIVRAINSRSLNGSTPDYRTLDHAHTTVPIRMRKEGLAAFLSASEANENAGPDIPDEMPRAGTLTPSLWANNLYEIWKRAEDAGWLQLVDTYPPQAEWNTTARRIMSIAPTIVADQNHQLGLEIRQTAV